MKLFHRSLTYEFYSDRKVKWNPEYIKTRPHLTESDRDQPYMWNLHKKTVSVHLTGGSTRVLLKDESLAFIRAYYSISLPALILASIEETDANKNAL